MTFDELSQNDLFTLGERTKELETFLPTLVNRRRCQCGQVPWRHLCEKSTSQNARDRPEELIERIALVDESRNSSPQPGIRPVADIRRVNDAHLEACLTEAFDEGRSCGNVEGSGIEKHEIWPPVDPTFNPGRGGRDIHRGKTVGFERAGQGIGQQIAACNQDPRWNSCCLRPTLRRGDHDVRLPSPATELPPLVLVTVVLPPIKTGRSTFAPYGPRQFGP